MAHKFKMFCSFFVVFLGLSSPTWAQDSTSSGNENNPWNETLTQVRALKGSRGQALSNLNKVRSDMKGLKEGSPQMKEKLAEYAKLYKAYRAASQEYNQQLAILKYRFPDRLAKEPNRLYQPVEIENEAELAQKLDLDQRLTNAVTKSREQYADRSLEKVNAKSPVIKKAAEGPLTIREEEAVLLSK